MKTLVHPGGALFVLAAAAFLLRRFVPIDRVPLIGGALMAIALFAMIFGVVGGLFLTIMVRRGDKSD